MFFIQPKANHTAMCHTCQRPKSLTTTDTLIGLLLELQVLNLRSLRKCQMCTWIKWATNFTPFNLYC